MVRLLKTYQLGFTYNLGRNPQSGLVRVRESPWSTACKLQGDSQTCTLSSPLCPCDQMWSQGHSYMCPRCHRTPWTHITDCWHVLAWLGFPRNPSHARARTHGHHDSVDGLCASFFVLSTFARDHAASRKCRCVVTGDVGDCHRWGASHVLSAPRFPRDGEAGGRNSTPPAVLNLECSAGLYWATVQRVLVAQYSPTRPGSSRLGCPWQRCSCTSRPGTPNPRTPRPV